MTVYATNYTNRLNEMMDEIIHRYGFEHNRTIAFAREFEKRIENPCYQNREFMEKLFKGWMK